MKVYISPSLQEKNVGVGNYGTEEMRMNQIADVVCKVLKEKNVDVKRNNPKMTLSQAVEDSNKFKPDLHVAIHSNSANGKVRGCEVFCHSKGGTGEQLANNIYLALASRTPSSDRGVKEGKDYYRPGKHMYETFKTKAPAALVEVAFHDNKEDAEWVIKNIRVIGQAIAKAVLKTLGII